MLSNPDFQVAQGRLCVHVLDARQENLSAQARFPLSDLEARKGVVVSLEANAGTYLRMLLVSQKLRTAKDVDTALAVFLKEFDGNPLVAKALIEPLPTSRTKLQKLLRKHLTDLAPVDTFFGLSEYARFLSVSTGMHSFDNLGTPLVAVVNVLDLDNAYFNGEYMVFGTGKDSFWPLVSVDVIGHELGHGVVQGLGGLEYKGHSGALNESLADVLGCMFEFFVQEEHGDKPGFRDVEPDFFIGEDLGVQTRYLRNMEDPESAPQPQPRCLGGKHYVDPRSSFDHGGVHVNSGIPNFVFVRLCSILGREEAFDLVFETYRSHLKTRWTLQQYALALLSSASERKLPHGRKIRELLQGCRLCPPPPEPRRPTPPNSRWSPWGRTWVPQRAPPRWPPRSQRPWWG